MWLDRGAYNTCIPAGIDFNTFAFVKIPANHKTCIYIVRATRN